MDKLDVEEREKIASWQREKKDAASGVGWMYKGNKPDSEEYLLGKRIDKHVKGEEEKKEDEASVIFKERIKANIALDVASKMREDPLFAIKRKEEESRKKLLENPIRMKELQKLINQQELERAKKEKKPKKHKKKDKKAKKKKKQPKKGSSSESDSDDESEEDTDIMSKYLSILTSKHSGGTDRKRDLKTNRREGDGINSEEEGREFQNNRSKNHGRERDARNRDQRVANGYQERESNRDNTQRRERERDMGRHGRGSPRRDKVGDRRDPRDRQRNEDSLMDHRMRDREKQAKHRSKSPDIRNNTTDKHRENFEQGDRGKGHKQREYPSKRNKRSSSSESNDRNVGKKQRKQSAEKDSKGRDSKSTRQRNRSSSASSESSTSSGQLSEGNKREHQHSQLSKPYGLIMSKSAEEAARARKRSRSSSPSTKKHCMSPIPMAKQAHRQRSPPRRKLTEEEKRQKLEEMMKNAEWREDQRDKNVKKYREEDRERERRDNEKQSSGFISNLMVEHASSSSVEDRIRRNKYNIQRTRKDLDKNFTQK